MSKISFSTSAITSEQASTLLEYAKVRGIPKASNPKLISLEGTQYTPDVPYSFEVSRVDAFAAAIEEDGGVRISGHVQVGTHRSNNRHTKLNLCVPAELCSEALIEYAVACMENNVWQTKSTFQFEKGTMAWMDLVLSAPLCVEVLGSVCVVIEGKERDVLLAQESASDAAEDLIESGETWLDVSAQTQTRTPAKAAMPTRIGFSRRPKPQAPLAITQEAPTPAVAAKTVLVQRLVHTAPATSPNFDIIPF